MPAPSCCAWGSVVQCILRRKIADAVRIPETSRGFDAAELEGACVFIIQDPFRLDAAHPLIHVFHPTRRAYMFSLAHNFGAKIIYSALECFQLHPDHSLTRAAEEAPPAPAQLPHAFARPAVYQVYVPRYKLSDSTPAEPTSADAAPMY